MGLDTAFWILAVISVVSALAVVFLKDVFRAALFLVLCFFTVAGIYITLNADFLAAVQVLVYVGAVGILIIFAILFTRETQQGSLFNKLKIPALVFALVLLGTMIYSMTATDWSAILGANANVPLADLNAGGSDLTGSLGASLFSEDGFLLPVEIAGVMLLAAVLGGIVIMRDKDK
jgi:NADH-quinone oxidoreductase subunit J